MLRYLLVVLASALVAAAEKPSQIHLALTKNVNEMQVTWVTFDLDTVDGQRVEYRKSATTRTTYIDAVTTTFAQKHGLIRYIHRATMKNLTQGQDYVYQVGTPGNLSKEFTFKQPSAQAPYRICIFGDLGISNGLSIPQLMEEAEKRSFDLVIHVGDIAYDLFKDLGLVGDAYMNMMEPLLATVPYMVIPGNHEEEKTNNFTTYKNLFTMPEYEIGENHFYSFNFGPVHFVGLSSEYVAFHQQYGTETVKSQYEWLQGDLQNAVANRKDQPWIVAYHHRPFYCSNENSNHCTGEDNNWIRVGSDDFPGWEPLFESNKVDVVFSGHEHSYERFFPRSPDSQNAPNPYHNAATPVYIVTGTAGPSSTHSFSKEPAEYSAVRYDDYGFTGLTIENRTHIHLEQYSVILDKVVDEAWFSKDV